MADEQTDKRSDDQPEQQTEARRPAARKRSGERSRSATRAQASRDDHSERPRRGQPSKPDRDDDDDGDDDGAQADQGRRGSGRLNAARAARLGLQQIAELTGKQPEGIAAIERADDGWSVAVEVIEDRRIPSSADLMAIYQGDLSEDGELVGYRRMRRYKRGQGDTDYNGESW